MSAVKVEKATEQRLEELGVASWSPWSCRVETFDWEYTEDETAYIQTGRVQVTTEDGEQIEFGAGDLVFFPRGLRCTWNVLEPVRKVYCFA